MSAGEATHSRPQFFYKRHNQQRRWWWLAVKGQSLAQGVFDQGVLDPTSFRRAAETLGPMSVDEVNEGHLKLRVFER